MKTAEPKLIILSIKSRLFPFVISNYAINVAVFTIPDVSQLQLKKNITNFAGTETYKICVSFFWLCCFPITFKVYFSNNCVYSFPLGFSQRVLKWHVLLIDYFWLHHPRFICAIFNICLWEYWNSTVRS